jgi:xylulose-5-phosphate/fructose-6-phosphate phosphoketolase
LTLTRNPQTFRIFSPDELVSNKLDAVFDVTSRNFQWDVASRGQDGRVIEILSEHVCQGMLQGYTLTGRTGIFPSYEAFLGIIHTMMVQYSKFIKVANESWRKDFPCGSLNYIETSTWARQEHNGFSHQNPGFIGAILALKPKFARVYLPPDANCFLSTVAHCLRAKNYINLMVGSKQPTPVWLTPEEANAVSWYSIQHVFAHLLLFYSIALLVHRYGNSPALMTVSILTCECSPFESR